MAVITHTWVTRAYCPSCAGFLWTNPGSGSVICACGSSQIIEDVVVSGDVVTDDNAFTEAVRNELNLSEDDELILGVP